jgi:hypothetical protein
MYSTEFPFSCSAGLFWFSSVESAEFTLAKRSGADEFLADLSLVFFRGFFFVVGGLDLTLADLLALDWTGVGTLD